MALKRYGYIKGGRRGTYRKLAASQKFLPTGNSFVSVNSSGNAILALTAHTTLFGWAEAPQSWELGSTADTNGYWTSSSTAGADGKILIITDPSALYVARTDATMAETSVGLDCDIIGVNDGTAQTVDIGTSSTNVILIRSMDDSGDTDSAVVMINPSKFQIAAQS